MLQPKYLVTLLLVMAAFLPASSQVSVRDSSISMVLIVPSYGYQVPAGDMADRFGNNSNLGISFIFKNKKKWYISAEGNFIFGERIKEPSLYSNLTTEKGFIIGSDGLYADIRTFERGYYMSASYGRLFPVKKPNPNCGFFVQAGVGFFQHKIAIQDKKNAVPALQDEYLKGYDRLTNGLMFKQMAGYWYTGNTRLINFFLALEVVEGFTQNRRDYNFSDLAEEDKDNRIDILLGARIGWMMPLYKEAPDKFYTY
jgi:hypothetical protein